MKYVSFLAAVGMVIVAAAPSTVLAQATTSKESAAPVTGMKPDRTTAPLGVREAMVKREAVKRQKRAECRAKAKTEKVPLAKRPSYVKNCRAQSN